MSLLNLVDLDMFEVDAMHALGCVAFFTIDY